MSTAGNFFDNVARRGQELGGQAFDKMKSTFAGLRGEAAPAAGPANPNVGAGGSAEAQEYLAGKAAQDKAFAEAGAPAKPLTGMRGLAAKAGKAAGPVGAVINEGMSLAGNISAGENPVASFGRSALRGGATVLGGLGGAALGTTAGPVGTVAGGVAGAYAGEKAGDYAADKLFGPEKRLGQPAQPAAPEGAQPITDPSSPAVMEGRSSPEGDSLNGVTLRNNAVPASQNLGARPGDTTVPTGGTGSFQRTTPGNVGLRQNVGTPEAKPAPAGAPTSGSPTQAGGPAGIRGVPVLTRESGATDFKNARHEMEARGQDLTYASAAAGRELQRAQLNRELGNDNEKRVNEQIEQHAKAKVQAPEAGIFKNASDKATYDANVQKEVAATKNRFQYSLGDRKDGKTVQTLSQAGLGQLRDLDKLRDRVMDSRSNSFQTLRDLIGQKRFDSENLYSYDVARNDKGQAEPAERSKQGGYVVRLGNGNTIHVADAVSPDGKGLFVLFGSNRPVDTETMQLLKPALDAAKKKQGKI